MKKSPSLSTMKSRREILRGGLRWGGVLMLGGIASVLGWRSVHGNCVRNHPCGECPMLDGCGLPKALASKSGQNPQPITPSGHARRTH